MSMSRWRDMDLPESGTVTVARGSIAEAMFSSIPGRQPADITQDEATWLGEGGALTREELAAAL